MSSNLRPHQSPFMDEAIKCANAAFASGEVPVGAVIVQAGEIIATAHNLVETNKNPVAHAEMLVIQKAAALLQEERLLECDLYVTLEPCAMCAQAISHARIRRLYFGAFDPKSGGVDHGAKVFSHKTCHFKPEVYGGIQEDICRQLLTSFFDLLRR